MIFKKIKCGELSWMLSWCITGFWFTSWKAHKPRIEDVFHNHIPSCESFYFFSLPLLRKAWPLGCSHLPLGIPLAAPRPLKWNETWNNKENPTLPVYEQLFSYFNNLSVIVFTLIINWKYIESCIKWFGDIFASKW